MEPNDSDLLWKVTAHAIFLCWKTRYAYDVNYNGRLRYRVTPIPIPLPVMITLIRVDEEMHI